MEFRAWDFGNTAGVDLVARLALNLFPRSNGWWDFSSSTLIMLPVAMTGRVQYGMLYEKHVQEPSGIVLLILTWRGRGLSK